MKTGIDKDKQVAKELSKRLIGMGLSSSQVKYVRILLRLAYVKGYNEEAEDNLKETIRMI